MPADLWPALRFPSADLLSAAAGLFARPEVHADRVVGGRHEWREGPWPFLSFAPGMVRLQRVDVSRAEAAAERQRAADRVAVDLNVALGELEAPGPRRGLVTGWSAKSRSAMLRKVASLDLAPMLAGAGSPVMVTLTMPADWTMFAPTAEESWKRFDRWRRAWEVRWGTELACIWKREFQERGAPHWHLWLVPPTSDLAAFRAWVSESWNHALFERRPVQGPLRPDERGKHLRAGTGIDIAAGMRARDPKRLALYFLKESLGGEGKAYQNDPPEEWAHQGVGRFWGVRGIREALETVPLEPDDAVRAWRALRRLREHQVNASPRSEVVVRGHDAQGVARFRRVHRRRKVRQGAGWVAVNDGAATAAAIARHLERSRT